MVRFPTLLLKVHSRDSRVFSGPEARIHQRLLQTDISSGRIVPQGVIGLDEIRQNKGECHIVGRDIAIVADGDIELNVSLFRDGVGGGNGCPNRAPVCSRGQEQDKEDGREDIDRFHGYRL